MLSTIATILDICSSIATIITSIAALGGFYCAYQSWKTSAKHYQSILEDKAKNVVNDVTNVIHDIEKKL